MRDAYQAVTQRIAAAARRVGRAPSEVVMVAVTKTASPDQIRALIELGHVDFGENRVQHLEKRVAAMNEFLARRRLLGGGSTRDGHAAGPAPAETRWHMIGHLQRNKVKQVIPLVQLIHSVDSLRLAEELHAIGVKRDTPIDILLQVNTSGEPSKFGVASPAALHLAEQIDTMVNLRLRGLMVMAPYSDNPEDARPTFARAADIFHDIRKEGIGGETFNVLSMGMTNDFEVAIEEGANLIRVGRALFGEGDPNAPAEDEDPAGDD